MEILNWIENWYLSNCEGDWEHTWGVKIETIDNPGWNVKIDFADTKLENLIIDYSLVEKAENDWYGFSVKNSLYNAAGDPKKLIFLLEKFKEIVENYV